MSEVGDCPRELSASRLGYNSEPTPEWVERAAREGKRHEDWIIEDLIAEGNTVTDRQKEVNIEYPTFSLIGHIDGIINNGFSRLLEVKTMSVFEFDRWMRENFLGFPEYAAQITCYMTATKLPEVLYIVKNRSSGYEDKRIITKAPANLLDIIDRLNIATEFVQSGNLPEVEFNPNSIQCQRCRFNKLCAPEVKAMTPVEELSLHEATSQWRTGKRMEIESKRLLALAMGTFNIHTQATGIEKWRFDELLVSTVHVKERTDYSKKNLLMLFTEEQLKPAGEIKLPYDYIKVKDLKTEETVGEEAEVSE